MSPASKTRTTPRPADELAPLLQELRKFKAQGEDGFEGLIRDLLQHVTGRSLRLVKSGPQGGKDVVADGDFARPGIAIEAKRFGENTDLPLDELKSKLREALDGRPEIDIWGVAASRELKDPDWSELEKIGEEKGVPLLCLDWRSAPGTLPPLAALCAAGRHITENRLPASVKSVLDRIEQHPDFSAIVDEIRRKLTDAGAGFELARQAADDWLRDAVASVANARVQLQSHADLASADAHYVPRPGIEAALSQWWESEPKAPAVLLGDEGRGKTWVALSWCRSHFVGPNAPLIIAASAKDIRWTGPGDILSALLHRAMPNVPAAQLAARISRWLRTASGPPKILLLIDGLNEAWSVRWGEVVRSFEVKPWKGKVALLLTSRSAHWRDDLSRLSGATPEPIREIEVPVFTDAELVAYLGTYDLTKDQLPSALLELVKIPRFAKLAISLKDKIKDSEDITEARLVLEDWRDRYSQRGVDLRVDNDALIEFVAGLGREVLEDQQFEISRREIHDRLSEDSGLDLDDYRACISEIVEGHWLTPSKKPHTYTVSRHLLPFAIGLDLAKQVEALADETAIEEIIAKYEEHLRGAAIGVAILRAATSVSFARQKATPAARTALLATWMQSQNFSLIDFQELWPLVNRDPTLFLDLAERYFKANPVGYREGEYLPKAIANAAKWPNVEAELLSRLPRWAGAYGIDPVHWRHTNIPLDERRKNATEGRLRQWRAVEPRFHTPLSGFLRADPDDHLPELAFAIMSCLPRVPYLTALLSAALTHAVSDDDYGIEYLQWLIRANPHDYQELEDRLLANAAQLQALGDSTALALADILLVALATPRAMGTRSPNKLDGDEHSLILRHAPELGLDNIVTWPRPDTSLPAVTWANLLGAFSSYPEARLSTDDQSKLETIVAAIGSEPKIDDFSDAFGRGTSSFARWAHPTLGQAVRRVFGSLPQRPFATAVRLTHQLADVSLVLSSREREELLKGGLEKLGHGPPSSGQITEQWTRCYQSMVVVGLVGRPAAEQIAVLERLTPKFAFGTDLAELLSPPTTKDVENVFDRIAQSTDERVIGDWLGYLLEVDLPAVPSNSSILLDLVMHENKHLRAAAVRLIAKFEDETLGKSFVNSGWSWREGQDGDEALFGSFLIARCGQHLAFEDARGRVIAQALPVLVELRGMREDEIKILRDYLLGLLQEKISGRRVRHIGYARSFTLKEIYPRLVDIDDGNIVRTLKQVALAGNFVGFFDPFPLVEICAAIFKKHPEEGAEIWAMIKDKHRRSGMNMGDFNVLPFRAPNNDKIIALRQELLVAARSDDDLMQMVVPTLMAGHELWLISFIREAVNATSAGLIARGLTLAGMLDSTDSAEALWADSINPLLFEGWLDEVRATARGRYKRNVHARHWFAEFLSTRDPDKAFSCLTLFQDTLDLRYAIWIRPMIDAVRESLPQAWLNHVSVTHDTRESARKKLEDDWKKMLFATRTMNGIAPWF